MTRPTEVIRVRSYRRIYVALAIIGALLIIAQIMLNVILGREINPWAMLSSAALGFWGFYGMQPSQALKGGEFLFDGAATIITAIRSGRRKTDSIVVQKTEVDEIVERPADLPDTPDHGDSGSKKAAPRDQLGEAGE